jgi:hypothetical protein
MSFPVTINGNTYNQVDFLGYAYLESFPAIMSDVAAVAADVVTSAGNAATSETNAATSETNAATSESNAATSESNAAASAVSAAAAAASLEFPFSVTSGSSTAYTIDFTPDLTLGDGATIRVSMHVANGANPTLSVDGATARNIVLPDHTNVPVGALVSNYNYLLTYEGSTNKWVVMSGLVATTWQEDRDANGFDLLNAGDIQGRVPLQSTGVSRSFVDGDENKMFRWNGADARTFTVQNDATYSFPAGTSLGVFNDGTGVLTLQADTSVTVNSALNGSIALETNQGGVFTKVSANRWMFMGTNQESWS